MFSKVQLSRKQFTFDLHYCSAKQVYNMLLKISYPFTGDEQNVYRRLPPVQHQYVHDWSLFSFWQIVTFCL